MIYLDHNATTPVDQRVIEVMEPYFRETFGNPSSGHQIGQKAREGMERSRIQVASFLGCGSEEVIFTSSGTESDNLAIKGFALAYKDQGDHIITSKIEHEAVLNSCKKLEGLGFRVTYLSVDKMGRVDPGEVKKEIAEGTLLISIMYANNEVGTIQPLQEIGKTAKERSIAFHTDAVQAVGKIESKVNVIGCDLLSLSAHKIYGPKGVGALYIRKGFSLSPLLHGGPHERRLRAGTENVPGIVGLGKACEIASMEMEEEGKRLRSLRNRILEGLKKDGVKFTLNTPVDDPEESLPGTLNISFAGIEGEALLQALDLEGISVSTGSACESGSIDPSHVLFAMGISRMVAKGAIRISLGRGNTQEEIDKVIEILPKLVKRLIS
ncbi:cysteine desulfurase [candidate division TA06 bacterium]|nr:cysteine desulfurase [candidate division TA06 bacterium]